MTMDPLTAISLGSTAINAISSFFGGDKSGSGGGFDLSSISGGTGSGNLLSGLMG
jgi:hypothetical protein